MTRPLSWEADSCDLTIFIACLNEEQGILSTLETVLSALKDVGCTYDIVVIDDASTDRTVELVRSFLSRHPQEPITLYVNDLNQGLGANFAEGAFRGRGKYYRLVCGDDVESRETLVGVLKHLGEADIILTYPAKVHGRSWFRVLVSRSFTVLVNLLSGYRVRYYNGLAVNLRYNVMRWHSHSHGFGFQADLITRLLDMGASYIEIPVVQSEREGGSSKAFTCRNICSVAHTLLDIFIRRVGRWIHPQSRRQGPGKLRMYRAGSQAGDEEVILSYEDVARLR
ncbi:MAG: glycosyltransferase family 2 protein [Betaproteobacteria bacterium]|nr:glycosyltransferase family 2 protein [Betaproteobacteria bacterium]NCA17400.1 glycosyltransferase family 2 protein [Betaproteobacteria bacterium]